MSCLTATLSPFEHKKRAALSNSSSANVISPLFTEIYEIKVQSLFLRVVFKHVCFVIKLCFYLCILEAQFVISDVEEDSMSDDKFDEAYTYLQEALGLVEETKNIIICNMKGE